MRTLAFKPLVALTVLCFACSSEDNVKVTDFTLHECKQSDATGKLETGRETADFAGLECVAWRFSETSTAIDLINRVEGCGFDGNEPEEAAMLWTPTLTQSDSDALTYSVSWESEGASACGACVHDFSIAANAVSIDAAPLDLELKTRSCNASECKWTEESVEILESEIKEGIRCRYVDWNHVLRQPERGKLGSPPRDGACDDKLVAVEIKSGSSLCLNACSSDDDCQKSLTACKDGACQLSDPW
jgi:hypothetical protein